MSTRPTFPESSGEITKIMIDAFPSVHRKGHRDRQQSDSDDGRSGAGDETPRWSSRSTPRFPKCVRASRARPKSRPQRRATCSRFRSRRRRSARWSSTTRARSCGRRKPTASGRGRRRAASRRRSSSPARAARRPGVFLVRDGKAVFTPIKTGIAGYRYFESLGG